MAASTERGWFRRWWGRRRDPALTGQGDAPASIGTEPPEFLVKDYELKIGYFTNHLTRMWTRFGMFVTLETALVAVLIVQGKVSSVAVPIAFVEICISVLWWWMGRHDRRLVRIYRSRVNDAAEELRRNGLPASYRSVIDLTQDEATREQILEAAEANEVPFVPALIPFLLIFVWLLVVVGLVIF